MKVKTHKDCKQCGNPFKLYSTTDKYCSAECKRTAMLDKPLPLKKRPQIPRFSKKATVLNSQYSADRIIFLGKPENKICPVTNQPTTDVHHKKGRKGFADDWARLNNIPLLLDQRYWLALSREGHRHVEEHPEWAKENGYSLNRLSNG